MQGTVIADVVRSVTKKWAKQRKREERDAHAKFRRRTALVRRSKVTVKDAAYHVMEEAYLKASSNNTLPAHARQIMYAARGRILELTGEDRLNDAYFTQRLLPDYMADFPEETAAWDVVFDARGNFHEPHTGRIVPLGTLSVRQYLEQIGQPRSDELGISGGGLYPTCGPENRYQAVLFIEKEGFLPLLQRVRLAERYDIAIMSTKGLSVVASRALVDRVCAEHDTPLLVLHDFDKAGFSIVGTLSRDTRRYTFENDIEVVDLGLRLEDVKAHALESEDVHLKSDPTANLLENGATAEEVEFLRQGKRVELNAFASGDFVQWIESKLEEHGVRKVLPADDILERAYRRELTHQYARQQVERVIREAEKQAGSAKVPKDLRQSVLAQIEADRSLPWDSALATVTRKGLP
ncbi:MAG: hypothetical protein ABIP48_17690 [Planctomycetota bacterium]